VTAAEPFEIAEMIVEAGGDQFEHLFGDRVGAKPHPVRRLEPLGQRLAVVLVEVPRAARRLALLHQEARPAAHLAVKILHPPGLVVLHELGEIVA